MDLTDRANLITSRKRSPYKAGTIDKIFEYTKSILCYGLHVE